MIMSPRSLPAAGPQLRWEGAGAPQTPRTPCPRWTLGCKGGREPRALAAGSLTLSHSLGGRGRAAGEDQGEALLASPEASVLLVDVGRRPVPTSSRGLC